jgi:hypothetical protein
MSFQNFQPALDEKAINDTYWALNLNKNLNLINLNLNSTTISFLINTFLYLFNIFSQYFKLSFEYILSNFFLNFLPNLVYQILLEKETRDFVINNILAILFISVSLINNFTSLITLISNVFVKLFYILLWLLNIIDKILVNIIKIFYKRSVYLINFLFTYLHKIYFKLIFWLNNNGSEIVFFLAKEILIFIGLSFRLLSKFIFYFSYFCNKIVFTLINPFIKVGHFVSIVGYQFKLNLKENKQQKCKINKISNKKTQRINNENTQLPEIKIKTIKRRRNR